ncbi:MAG: hypothetical protein ISS79_01180 [Phycisphaerae bacterium]|nr:hypothetical protein [Phycisphaerae bacterium]
MSQAGLLLKAYYEAVYELLEAEKDSLAARIGELLTEEVERRGFEAFDEEKYSAYRDACTAFVDERIETFNPIGYQYTFDRARTQDAFELELQLNWYDARAEFEALAEAAADKAQSVLTDENLRPLAAELMVELGVFPNNSIIAAYKAAPTLQKLPDYIVARAIEEIAG